VFRFGSAVKLPKSERQLPTAGISTWIIIAGPTALGVPLAFAGGASAGGAIAARQSHHEAAEAGRWALAIALSFLVIGLPLIVWLTQLLWRLFRGLRGRSASTWPGFPWGRSLVVGADNRVSTSKTIAVIWTYSVASALLSFLIARWLGHPGAYENLISSGVNAQYALLFGGPLGAAILAKGIVSSQLSNGATAKPPADASSPAQLVQNDTGETDLGDLQYVLFNFVALAFFYGEILRVPQEGMPTIPDVLLGLTSVAAVGYVAKKALTGPAVISSVVPPAARAGDPVTIVTSGMVQPGDDLSLVTVTFGDARAGGPTSKSTTTQGVLLEVAVPTHAAGSVDITVAAPNGKSAKWPSFKVKPAIDTTASTLKGAAGQTVTLLTSGVTPLGQSLLGLSVTIGGHATEATLDPNSNLEVKVPSLAPGTYRIDVATPGGTDRADFQVIR
jgi:hypothetical protein